MDCVAHFTHFNVRIQRLFKSEYSAVAVGNEASFKVIVGHKQELLSFEMTGRNRQINTTGSCVVGQQHESTLSSNAQCSINAGPVIGYMI